MFPLYVYILQERSGRRRVLGVYSTQELALDRKYKAVKAKGLSKDDLDVVGVWLDEGAV